MQEPFRECCYDKQAKGILQRMFDPILNTHKSTYTSLYGTSRGTLLFDLLALSNRGQKRSSADAMPRPLSAASFQVQAVWTGEPSRLANVCYLCTPTADSKREPKTRSKSVDWPNSRGSRSGRFIWTTPSQSKAHRALTLKSTGWTPPSACPKHATRDYAT